MKNSDCGREGSLYKGIPLNLSKDGNKHTNPNGSVINVTKVTSDMYFNKRKAGTSDSGKGGSSWMFPNHLEYNGWLWMNGLVEVEVEELEEEWS